MKTLAETQASVLRQCANFETAVGNLYRDIAERVPGCQDFWSRLAKEEDEHARDIRLLGDMAEKGMLVVNLCNFSPQSFAAMKTLVISLRRNIRMAPPTDHARAARLAIAAEGALIEQPLFTALHCEDQAYAGIVARLRASSEAHMACIVAAASFSR